eukprot:3796867-Pyramimonas_sp.AAC.1
MPERQSGEFIAAEHRNCCALTAMNGSKTQLSVQWRYYQKKRKLRNKRAFLATAGLGHKEIPRHKSKKRPKSPSPFRTQSGNDFSVLAVH